MTINTSKEIFKFCVKHFKGALRTDKNATITISVNNDLDEYEFNLTVFKDGIANIEGGSDLSCLWGYYEYLERYYGYIWKSPDDTIKSDFPVNPFPKRTLNYNWKHPYDLCWLHHKMPPIWREFLNLHRCISRRDESTYSWKCHQGDWWKDPTKEDDLFALDVNGKRNKSKNEKLKYHLPKVQKMIAEQLIGMDGDVTNLFIPDGVLFDSGCIEGEEPLAVWQGMTDMTDYMLDFYEAIAKLVPLENKQKFDTLAYLNYKHYPKDRKFDGTRFNLFYVEGDNIDYANYRRWQKAFKDIFFRPNWGYACCSVENNEFAMRQATIFSRVKRLGMKGFMLDVNGIDFVKHNLFIYLIMRQIYTTKTVKELFNEFNG